MSASDNVSLGRVAQRSAVIVIAVFLGNTSGSSFFFTNNRFKTPNNILLQAGAIKLAQS